MSLIWSLFDAAEKGLGKCTRGCGGKRTEPGYKNNTCDLAELLQEEEDDGTWKLYLLLLPLLLSYCVVMYFYVPGYKQQH